MRPEHLADWGPPSLAAAPRGPAPARFEPIRMVELELGRPLPRIPALDGASGRRHHRARALVRLHSQPLGLVDLNLPEGDLSAEACGRQVWEALGHQILEHLRHDALPAATGLGPAGLPHPARPECVQEREANLAAAPAATIVVATRDRCDSLARCLDSLLALRYPAFEAVVVDNAPATEATAELIRRQYADRAVRYVREDRPGLAGAHNRGLREVRTPIVAFTDDDVVVDQYWLAELVSGFSAAAGVVCVTGLILPAELETPAQLWFEQFGGLGKGFSRRVFDLRENRPANPLYPYAAGVFGSGASMAFKTEALRGLGGFDPALGTGTPAQGGDDLAVFSAVIARGYRLVYTPAALLYHWHTADWAGLRRRARSYGVGLTAYLTKCVWDRPALLLDFARRLPLGLAHALSPNSEKNARKGPDYPGELTRLEQWGMLAGPAAYLRSRWQARRPPPQSPPTARPGEGVYEGAHDGI